MALITDIPFLAGALGKTGRCSSPSFSPDGRDLAVISDLSGLAQIWRIPLHSGSPQQITSGKHPIRRVTWSKRGLLAYEMNAGSGGHTRICLCRPDGSEQRELVDELPVELGAIQTLGTWTRSGRFLGFSVKAPEGRGSEACLFDLDERKIVQVTRSGAGDEVADIHEATQHVLVRREVDRTDADIVLVDLATGKETLLTDHRGPAQFSQARFVSEGRCIWLVTDLLEDRTVLAQLNLTGGVASGSLQLGKLTPCRSRSGADLDWWVLAPDRGSALLCWNQAGQSELEWMDTHTQAVSPGPAVPVEVVLGAAISQQGRYALNALGAKTPSNVWVGWRSRNHLRQVTHNSIPDLPEEGLAGAELVHYTGHDGLPLSGWFYRPLDGKENGAVVLNFHGGPESQERPMFHPTYQGLAALGMAVFAPNVRGSTGFGKAFAAMDKGALRFDAIEDVRASAEMLVDKGWADPARIGIMGASYGGYLTMAGLSFFPGLFAAGVTISGLVNLITFFQHTDPAMARRSKAVYGDPETEADLLRNLSPYYRLDQVSAPVLVVHGALDTNVPLEEAQQLSRGLKRRGKAVETLVFADEGHGVHKPANRVKSLEATLSWFARHLGMRRLD